MGLEQAIMKASTCVPCGLAISLRGTAAQSSPPVCHTQAGEDSRRHAVHNWDTYTDKHWYDRISHCPIQT